MSESADQPKRRNWRTAVAVIVVAVLLLVMLLLIFDSIGASALNKAVLQARAMGGSLTIDEILAARKPCPEGENGALVILSVKPRLDALSDVVKTPEYQSGPPLPLFGNETIDLGRRWRPDTAQVVADFLAGAQNELAAIDSLRDYPGGQFPIRFQTNIIDTLLPHLSSLRASIRLKSLQVLDRAMGGDNSRLADDVEIMTRQVGLLDGEPVFISVLVTVACEALTVSTLEQACALASVEPDQLARIQELLPRYDVNQRIRSSIRYERAFFIGATDHFRSTGDMSGMAGFAGAPALRHIPGAKGWLMRDEAFGIELFNRIIAQPDAAGMLNEAQAVAAEIATGPRLGMLTSILMPSFGRGIQLTLASSATTECARTAMAAERYRLATGSWPASLDDLVPEYIEAIGEDPFAPNKSLRMSVQSDRLVIYSVGLDGDDDRGVVHRGSRVNMDIDDLGFILLNPDQRNQPPLPRSQPADNDSE